MQLVRNLLAVHLLAIAAFAGSLTVTVKDPSGAVVPGAAVLATSPDGLTQTRATGPNGVAAFKRLPAGKFKIAVQHEGFADAEASIDVKESGDTTFDVKLAVAAVETNIDINENVSAAANADPNYRALRTSAIAESYLVENIELKRDAATIVLRKGTLSFTSPVLGRTVTAVFSGQGSFHLTPVIEFEQTNIKLMTGSPEVTDEFDSAVFYFTDATYDELKRSLKTPAPPDRNADLLRNLRQRIRHRVEIPRSEGEYLLQGENVPNVDADLLADLYNPQYAGSFSAYLHGHKYGDLRFFLKPLGALPGLQSTEEVGLVNIDVNLAHDGVLYLTHRIAEWQKGIAMIDEDRRIAAALHFKMEVVIGKNEHLTSVENLKFKPLRDGDRVLPLDLLPNLRVSRVSMNGKDIGFIQEGRKLDSSFYIVLPQPAVKGSVQEIQIEYAGDKVIHNEGGGSFAVGARTNWYAALNAFRDRATYDLTFKVPRRYTLVSVGQLSSTGKEDNFAVTHWVSTVPLSVAGFNYGEFKLKQVTDANYGIEVYATPELPDYMHRFTDRLAITPTSLAASTLVDAENSMRCFRHWFGDVPFGRIAITQQPQMNFGQSWPSLVYLPLFAFLDSTQRYMVMGQGAFGYADFIQEVTPHEVAHQWWGHLVGWNSYHDQWLSEGFADFSAGLFLEATEKKRDKYLTYWERSRKRIIEKTAFGYAPNDAGPIWMGLRLNTFRTANAYNNLVYPKGGFVLHMLRYLMQDPKTGDADFIAMMHDFTSRYANQNASTGDFQAVVEKHMKPQMDLDGNHRMAWFFGEWVYGKDLPEYHLSYHLTPEPDGKFIFTGKVTQSGVPNSFRMRVPIYLDFGVPGGPVKLANVGVSGNNTSEEIKVRIPQRPKKVMLNYNFDVLARQATADEL